MMTASDFIPQDVLAVANAFIQKGLDEGEPVDHMKLQKLCYLAQAWHIGATNQMLFSDDIEAWQYGPVIPKLYDALTGTGKEPITEQIHYPFNQHEVYEFSPQLTSYCLSLVDWIWSKYGHLSGLDLSYLTHQKDSPWHKTIENFGERYTIQPETISHTYKPLFQEVQSTQESAESH